MRGGAKGDPAAFRFILERALATSATPRALQIQRLPSDLAPRDLKDHISVREFLYELGDQGPLSHDARLHVLADGCGWRATLQETARMLALSADTEL